LQSVHAKSELDSLKTLWDFEMARYEDLRFDLRKASEEIKKLNEVIRNQNQKSDILKKEFDKKNCKCEKLKRLTSNIIEKANSYSRALVREKRMTAILEHKLDEIKNKLNAAFGREQELLQQLDDLEVELKHSKRQLALANESKLQKLYNSIPYVAYVWMNSAVLHTLMPHSYLNYHHPPDLLSPILNAIRRKRS